MGKHRTGTNSAYYLVLLGSDLLLVNIVQNALEKAGRPVEVLTGRNMFPE